MKRALSVILCVLFLLTTFAGCQFGGGDKEKLTVVYLPDEEANETLDSLKEGFASDMSEAIGVEVEELLVTDYNAVVEALRSGQADLAYLGSLTFCLAYERAGAIPMARKDDGTYYSVLVARADDDSLQSIQDVKGKNVFFSDPASGSANLIPSAEIMRAFPEENLNMETLHTNDAFFATTIYSGADLSSVLAVLNGDADVACVADIAIDRMVNNGEIKREDIKVIHTSEPIPSSCFAMRKEYPAETREKILEFLLSYDNPEYFERVLGHTGTLVPATVEDYQDLLELNKKLNPGT